MRKKIVLFMGVVVLLLSGCDSIKVEKPKSKDNTYGQWEIISSTRIPTKNREVYVDIIRDNTTECQYLATHTNSTGLTLTPLYGADGQVQGCTGD